MTEHEFTPEERQRLEQELLELQFDCHPDPQALKRRIEEDPRLQALQIEVEAQATLLKQAASVPAPEFELPETSDAPGLPRWRWWTRTWGRTTIYAAAAAAVLATFGLRWFLADWHQESLQARTPLVTLSGPTTVPPGSPFDFLVQAEPLDGSGRPVDLHWQAIDADGQVLFEDRVSCEGSVTVPVAASLVPPQRIEVRTAQQDEAQVLELGSARPTPLVHLRADKPTYRPGEPVYLRGLLLDRLDLRSADPRRCRFVVKDPRGNQVWSGDFVPDPESGDGNVAWGIWNTHAGLTGGTYSAELSALDGSFPPERCELVLRAYQPPKLQKELRLDRKSYAPGEEGRAQLEVVRMAGGPAADAELRVSLVIDGSERWTEQRSLDAGGRATIDFEIPHDVTHGAARLVAMVQDGGIVETQVEPFVVPTGRVEVGLYPEGGELVTGIPSRVYVEVTDTLGRATEAEGRLLDGDGNLVAEFRSEHQGRGRLWLTPEAGERYELQIGEQRFALPEALDNGLVLTALSDAYPSSEPLGLLLRGRGAGRFTVAAYCRGALLAQRSLSPNGDGMIDEQLALSLPEAAYGAIRVTVFDDEMRPLTERLVQRLPSQRLQVELSARHDALEPGGKQQVRVAVRDERGEPVRTALGLWVSDQAALSLGIEKEIGLLDRAALFADVETPEDVEDFFVGRPGAELAADLYLGTRGWRRFLWQGDDQRLAALADASDWRKDQPRREGFMVTTQATSNYASLGPALQDAGRDLIRSRRRFDRAIWSMLALLTAALLTDVILRNLYRSIRGRQTWSRGLTPAMTIAGVLFLVSLLIPNMLGSRGATAGMFRLNVRATSDLGLVSDDEDLSEIQTALVDLNGFGIPADIHIGLPLDLVFSNTESATVTDSGRVGWMVRRFAGDDEDEIPGWWPQRHPYELHVAPALNESFARHRDTLKEQAGRPKLRLPQPSSDFYTGDTLAWAKLGSDAYITWSDSRRSRPSPTAKRQYAHEHVEREERRDFTETIYWNPLLVTDDRGEASFDFDLSDAVTTWSVRADAHGAGRVGQAELRFDSQAMFHLMAKLPAEVSAGDRLQIPIAFECRDERVEAVELQLETGTGIRLDEGGTRRLKLKDGRGRALVAARIEQMAGETELRIAAVAGRYRDEVRQSLRIAPRGFPHRRSQSGELSQDRPAEFVLALPDDMVRAGTEVKLKVFPSPLSILGEGLKGILRQPTGCFEQASSSNYPNVMVLSYLEASGDAWPEVAAHARELLPKGYGKLVGYECDKLGYEWFGHDPGHEELTAYGLLQFHDMSKVFAVDGEMLDRTRDWLLSRRDGDGRFNVDRSSHRFGRAPQQTSDAYIIYALLATGSDVKLLQVEIGRLAERAATSGDAYELALIANALDLAGRDEAETARQRLFDLQRPDGSLRGEGSITGSRNRDLAVETTAFAALAWMKHAQYAGAVAKALSFLQLQRSASGTFGATQATIMALKALTAHASATRGMTSSGTLRVLVGEQLVFEQSFSEGDAGAIELDLLPHLLAGENQVRLEVEGEASLPWACDLAYFALTPADDPDAALSISTSIAKPQVQEGNPVSIQIVLENREDDGLPMSMAIIGLPAGIEIPTAVLDDLLEAERFDLWEIKGRELVLYFRELAPRERVEIDLDGIARIPGTSSGPASRAYLYYSPAEKRWSEPLAVEIRAAD